MVLGFLPLCKELHRAEYASRCKETTRYDTKCVTISSRSNENAGRVLSGAEQSEQECPGENSTRFSSSRTSACYVFVDDSIAAVSRPRSLAARDQERPGNSSIKGRKHCTIRLSELCEMAIGRLLRCFDPCRKMRNIKIVGNKCKLQDIFCLQPQQQRACLRNRKSI